jgi:hypothetical protein
MDRVPQSFELAKDGRGRRAYVAWLEALLPNLLASKTPVRREWLGQRLGMGHPGSVSRMLGEVKRNKKLLKRFNELEIL